LIFLFFPKLPLASLLISSSFFFLLLFLLFDLAASFFSFSPPFLRFFSSRLCGLSFLFLQFFLLQFSFISSSCQNKEARRGLVFSVAAAAATW
jgi:hypothetical protein